MLIEELMRTIAVDREREIKAATRIRLSRQDRADRPHFREPRRAARRPSAQPG